ncbi:MAG: hypothetical protein LBH72_04535, partial [Proteiniphilum sp.]|nr:hypothetical protein [Proteiniphilum sp.]
MKRITTSLLLLWTLSSLIAQENSIREQILGYKDSEYDFVNKGRRLLAARLQDYEIQEAINVKNGLLDEFRGNVSEVFYIGEYIHLLLLTGEFDELLNYLKQVDFEQPVSHNVRVSSQTDGFFTTVFTQMTENADILEMDIKDAVQDGMERDFLLLLLHDIAVSVPPAQRSRSPHTAEINQMADRFLFIYPGSPYEQFVREHIRLVYKETDWGMYGDIGFGAAFNQGNLSRQFANGTVMDMSFECRHRKLMGIFGFELSGHQLKRDLPVNNTIWEEKRHSLMGNMYLNAGYLVFENRRWSIYPYIGGGFTGYSAAEKDIEENERL